MYLPGIGGHPGMSPAMIQIVAAGYEVIVPELPGFAGRSGFQPPDDYLGWLVGTWDAVDAALGGDCSPCHVIGASAGGMLAADLAVFRPELVRSLTLIAPFGILMSPAQASICMGNSARSVQVISLPRGCHQRSLPGSMIVASKRHRWRSI